MARDKGKKERRRGNLKQGKKNKKDGSEEDRR